MTPVLHFKYALVTTQLGRFAFVLVTALKFIDGPSFFPRLVVDKAWQAWIEMRRKIPFKQQNKWNMNKYIWSYFALYQLVCSCEASNCEHYQEFGEDKYLTKREPGGKGSTIIT